MKKSSLFLVVAIASISSGANAGGFCLNEMSARGNAMQGAIVGSTRDISAVYFNPANLTELGEGGIYSMVGMTFVRPDYNVNVMGKTVDQDEHIFILPHIYLGGKLSEDFSWGFGEYSEYGLGTHYEGVNTWPLAADSTKTVITAITLSPTLAWQATEELSFGAGVRLMYMNLAYDRMIPELNTYFNLDADDIAVAYIAAMSYDVTDTIRLGVVYRSESAFSPDGDVVLSGLGMTTGVSGELTMPQSVMIGLNWQANEKLNLGFNATWCGWSCVKKIPLNFESPMFPDQELELNWHDAWRYSIGAEYQINANWAVQCGVTRDFDPGDPNHANTLIIPGNRDQFGLGATYSQGDWSVSFDYMLVLIDQTDRNIHGVETEFRDARTDTIGLTFAQKF